MADIFHSFTINAPIGNVFECISTPKGLDNWWTKSSEGEPGPGETYQLYFGTEYDWRAVVSKYVSNEEFELKITTADPDWIDTRVGFHVNHTNGITAMHFYHKGWPLDNEHHRISCYCWAMYLRILKRYLEFGEKVHYEDRLNS
jgi:uncharacterized protein YndB with AHSA1/START domain